MRGRSQEEERSQSDDHAAVLSNMNRASLACRYRRVEISECCSIKFYF